METKEKNRTAARKRPAQRPASGTNTQATAEAKASRRPEQTARAAVNTAGVQRPARSAGGTRPSAPQGTGPRKSAPQRSAQERAASRDTARRAAPARKGKQNALQNFISGVRGQGSEDSAAAKAARRRKERAEQMKKKRRRERSGDTPAVIYTQPQAFSRDKLLLQVLTVTAIVAALVLGMSVFFKVGPITVSGAETYSEWAVREASGISKGDNLLTFSRSRASAKIMAELAYVDEVRIGIKLPDTVIIYIEEMDVAYAVESSDGDWWLINSNGRVVEQITGSAAGNYTQVLGVTIQDPQVGTDAVAAEYIPQETLESGEPIPVTVTGAQRLSSALQILKALEANDIVGDAASINVSQLQEIVLWYGTRYEVLLGDTTRMEYKIACMNDAILQMSDYQSGILDVSFITRADQIVYTPFG